MCNPPILPPFFSSSNSPSSSSSSLSSNTNLYSKGIRNGTSLYRPMAKLIGSTSNSPHPPSFFLSDDTMSDEEQDQCSLDSCFLCKTHLHPNDDAYMYRGDVPFCSEECRQDQIVIDEAKEKRKKKKNLKILNKKSTMDNNNSLSSKSQEIHVRVAGTVIA